MQRTADRALCLQHKSIAALEGFYETADTFFIVMELVTGGDLFDQLVEHGPCSEREAATLLRPLPTVQRSL